MLYPLSYGGFGTGSLDSLARLVLGFLSKYLP